MQNENLRDLVKKGRGCTSFSEIVELARRHYVKGDQATADKFWTEVLEQRIARQHDQNVIPLSPTDSPILSETLQASRILDRDLWMEAVEPVVQEHPDCPFFRLLAHRGLDTQLDDILQEVRDTSVACIQFWKTLLTAITKQSSLGSL